MFYPCIIKVAANGVFVCTKKLIYDSYRCKRFYKRLYHLITNNALEAKVKDVKLFQQLQLGNMEALELLYRKYADKLYSYAYSLLHNHALAEDVVSDCFLSVYESLRRKEEGPSPSQTEAVSNVKAYFYAVCRNRAYHIMKEQARVVALPEDELPAEKQDSFQQLEDRMDLTAMVDRLPEQEREIVLLYCVHELKHKEIAGMINLPDYEVRRKYRKALKQLKALL